MNIRKKKLEITGWPVYPIAVGETALISEDTGMRRTSTVLRMKRNPRPRCDLKRSIRATACISPPPEVRNEGNKG